MLVDKTLGHKQKGSLSLFILSLKMLFLLFGLKHREQFYFFYQNKNQLISFSQKQQILSVNLYHLDSFTNWNEKSDFCFSELADKTVLFINIEVF